VRDAYNTRRKPPTDLPSKQIIEETENLLNELIRVGKISNEVEVALLECFLANLHFQEERLKPGGNLDKAFILLEEKENQTKVRGVKEEYINAMGIISFYRSGDPDNLIRLVAQIEDILKRGG